MSLMSMTGFGRGEEEGEEFTVAIELKSVNNRYRDFRIRLPQLLSFKEIDIKKKIEASFSRGSFDLSLSYKKKSGEESFDLNHDKIVHFLKEMQALTNRENISMVVNPVDFLRSHFQQEDSGEGKLQGLSRLVEASLDKAILELKNTRKVEGQKLAEKLQQHLGEYTKHLEVIEKNRELFKEKTKKRLLEKFKKDFQEVKVEPQRMAQEIVFYLEKIDIDEEINRIHIHLKKLAELLRSEGEAGRKIDFLVQELNRETNTIGSKSSTVEISEMIVEMKVHLEKIREQALNIE